MNSGKLIHIYANRISSFKVICCPILENVKNAKQKIPISKLHLKIWHPPKIIYQKFLRSNQKLFKNGALLGMAFFGPSLMFSKQEPSLNVNEVVVKQTKRDQRKSGKVVKILFNIYEAVCLLMRGARLALTFLPVFLLYPITYLGSYPESLWWKLLLTGIEYSGPIFIKFGQWASTRRDLFPEACCSQFSKLQRRSKPHPWSYTREQLIKAFGPNWRKFFVKIDHNGDPIGSGCVAQVYKVWMNEEQIKDKDILDEIIQEQQDDHEDDFIDDGLEVSGFAKPGWLSSLQETAEEREAILEFKRARDLKREREKAERAKADALAASPSDIKDVTHDLADELVFSTEKEPAEDGKETRGEALNAERNGVEEAQESGDEVVEHALVEQWQAVPESLEKSLPVSEEDLGDLEGLVPVALKVLHPRVYKTFQRDTSILRFCASMATVLFPSLKWLSLERCVQEFFDMMSAQIDLRKEADNLDKFIEAFSAVDTVRFPRPVRPFVTRRILVETFEEGEPMINFLTDDKPEAIKKNLAKIGVDALLKMIFTDNLTHGDLHPGNLLVQNQTPSPEGEGVDSSSSSSSEDGNAARVMMVDIGGDTFVMSVAEDPRPLRICILDCGIIARLSPENLDNLKAVLQEVIRGNGMSVADLFLKKSEQSCENPDAFRESMSELVCSVRENALSMEQVDVGLLLQEVLSLLLRHRIRLESAFSAVVLAVFVLEGLGRSLDPEMDILERARPLIIS